ncbi:MAG: hypothetical protein ACKO4T_15665 [Planctomycetaceae bacterium]
MIATTAESRAAAVPWWADRRAGTLAILGLVMVAGGLGHLPVWAVLGGPWEGPVTWRKPILFGISGGLTALSLGWVWSLVPARRGDTVLASATAWALFVEVFLIDLQRWRGVGSHFNRDTPLDSALFDAMGALIVAVTLVIADLTLRLFMRRPRMPADTLLAARSGMLLLSVSCLLGIWVGMHGEARMQAGLDPVRLGAAGVPKFPHGVVIHAVQWLPALAWAMRRAGIAEPARVRLVGAAAAGSATLLVYALVQTALGRARFDVVPATAALLAAAVIGLGVPVVVTAWAWLQDRRSPPPAAGRIA